jgi:DNA gyrase/topoisomerase IV subunit A
VRETDELMLITNKGQMVRTRVKEIRITGRKCPRRETHGPQERREAPGIAPVVANEDDEESAVETVEQPEV